MPNAELDPNTPFADNGEMVRAMQDPRWKDPHSDDYRRLVESKIALMPDNENSFFTNNTRRVDMPFPVAPAKTLEDEEADADKAFAKVGTIEIRQNGAL